MRETLITILALASLSAFAITPEERRAIQEQRAQDAEVDRIKKLQFSDGGAGANCSDASAQVKNIQGLLSKQKLDEKEGGHSLLELEQERDKIRSRQVLLNGIRSINSKYKEFINDISGVNGYKMPGYKEGDESKEFSLGQLQADLEASKEHIENARTMGLIDALIKDAIKNPEDLLGEENIISGTAVEKETAAKLAVEKGRFSLSKSTSKAETFEQLETACNSGNQSTLCKVIKDASDSDSRKIKASIEGFVRAFRVSEGWKITGGQPRRLREYREALLSGIEGVQPGKMTQELKDFENKTGELSNLAEDAGKVSSLIDDLKQYKYCLAQKATDPGFKSGVDCKLTEAAETYGANVESMAKLQARVTSTTEALGGNNAQYLTALEKVHDYQGANKKLAEVGAIYSDQDKFRLEVGKKVAANQEKLKKLTANIFSNVTNFRNDIAIHSKMLGAESYDKSLQDFLTSKPKENKKPSIETVQSTNTEMNKLMREILQASCLKGPEKDKCTDAKIFKVGNDKGNLFKVDDSTGEMNIDSNLLDEFLKETDAAKGNLTAVVVERQNKLDEEMADVEKKIDGLKNNTKYKTLNNLLAYYGDRVQNYCSNTSGLKASWRCVEDKSNKNSQVYSLVDEAGKVLARMPQSPERLAITDLDKKCSLEFIKSFEKVKEEKEMINAMCTHVASKNEDYLKQFEPTPEEKIYPITNRYWDGNDWIEEKRQRKRWAIGQSVAEGALKFLPWELNRQVEKTKIDIWETSTINSIQARNDYLTDFYTNGTFYPYPGIYSPLYLGSYGGAVYNNGFTTVGAGGYFPMTTTTPATVSTGSSAGFDFSTTGI